MFKNQTGSGAGAELKSGEAIARARSVPLLVLAWLCLLHPSGQARGQDTDLTLKDGRAGPVVLGATVDEVYSIVGRERVTLVDEFLEGMFSPAIAIDLPDAEVSPAIIARVREYPCLQFAVWGITVRDPRFRTPEGVGVGSTVGDLRRAYEIRLSHEEGSSAIAFSIGMSFGLESFEITDQTVVTSVWIWPNPYKVREERCPGRGAAIECSDSG